jgi:dolichyl-phosphate beta-glucosyltransferase
MSEPQAKLSVILPCLNEAARIGDTLAALKKYFDAQDYKAEIIVVDDGSSDETERITREACPSAKLISYEINRGKGYAAKRGINEAEGAYWLVYDADGSTPISELEKVWPKFDQGAAVVIGSRALPESKVEAHQPWYRENMGRIYNLLLRGLGLTSFPDTQCGFKVFDAMQCGRLFEHQRCDGFGADCELLYLAEKDGLRVCQVPVRWLNSPDSRVHAIWHSLEMIGEALGVRWRATFGGYD